MANVTSMAKKAALIAGCSVRSTVRMTGVSKGRCLRLLSSVGKACQAYQDATIRNVAAKRAQVDEIWTFCYAKQKNVKPEHFDNGVYAGDVGPSLRLTQTRS